jgi:hypothetical protein
LTRSQRADARLAGASVTAKVGCYRGDVMPFDANARLKLYIERIIDKKCTEAEIIEILHLIIHVLEKDRVQKEYPHLSLYCDWVQHTEIDRHPRGLTILEFMNDIIISHWSSSGGLVEEVSRTLGLSQLRQEILMLFMSKEIPTAIVDSLSNWRMFVGVLLNVSMMCVTSQLNFQAYRNRLPEDFSIECKHGGGKPE